MLMTVNCNKCNLQLNIIWCFGLKSPHFQGMQPEVMECVQYIHHFLNMTLCRWHPLLLLHPQWGREVIMCYSRPGMASLHCQISCFKSDTGRMCILHFGLAVPSQQKFFCWKIRWARMVGNLSVARNESL